MPRSLLRPARRWEPSRATLGRTNRFEDVRRGFLKEIRKIRDEPSTKEEVEDAKKYLTGSLAFKTITCEQVASLLLSVDRLGLGLNYLDDYRKGVSAVTPEDVQAMAKKYLDPDRLIIVAVGHGRRGR